MTERFTDLDLEEGTRALYWYALGTKGDWSTDPEQDREYFRSMVRVVLRGVEEGRRDAAADGQSGSG